MRIECYQSDRRTWLLDLAQEWLLGLCFTDIIITCVSDEGDERTDFQCHKLVISDLLRSYLPESMLDEVDHAIITGLSSIEFQHYLNLAYGLNPNPVNAYDLNPEPIKVKIEQEDDYDYIIPENLQVDLMVEDQKPIIQKTELVKCPLCELQYTTQRNLKNHFLKIHPEKDWNEFKKKRKNKLKVGRFKCPICDRRFFKLSKYKVHFEAAHSDEIYVPPLSDAKFTCVKCSKVFETKDEKMEHIRSDPNHVYSYSTKKEKRNRHPCEVCGKEVETRSMKAHMRANHTTIRCSCGATFTELSPFYDHKNDQLNLTSEHSLVYDPNMTPKVNSAVMENLPFSHSCLFCEVTFQTVAIMKQHLLDDHYDIIRGKNMIYKKHGNLNVKISFCQICDKYFKLASDLRKHNDTNHAVIDEQRVCQDCGKSFKNSTLLDRHYMNNHHRLKIKCKYCDYETSAKPQLREHERTHTGVKPEICGYCGKGFTTKKSLDSHVRLHTGEKPYHCRFCDARFVQRTGINVHVQTHHKEFYGNGTKIYEFIKS